MFGYEGDRKDPPPPSDPKAPSAALGPPHGSGTFTFPVGKHKGQFENGEYQGQGKFTFSNTTYVDGTFAGNKVHGRAKQELNKNGESFEGNFVDGARDGDGSYAFANGDSYVGAFKNSVPHGHGLYKYKNGCQYEGQFIAGEKQGQGKETYPDGAKYDGSFAKNLRHGQGVYIDADGITYSGEFDQGKMGKCERSPSGWEVFSDGLEK